MRHDPRAKIGVALLLLLGLTACADTSRHPSAKPEKVTRTTATATVSSSSSSTTQPPPTTTSPPPTSRTATLSVSTAALEVGQPITVSGNDCPAGYSASANLLPSTQSASPAFQHAFCHGKAVVETTLLSNGWIRVTSGSNATWTISTSVPMVVPGPSLITAQCVPPDSTMTSGFIYQPRAVSVSTPYTLSVAPGTTVAPGSTLVVQSQGGGCGQIALPFVALYETAGTTQTVVYSWAQSGSGADWQASLVVPSGLMAGRYRLEADCDYSRGAIYGSYAPLEITIE